jgi:hypothetical protein
MTSPAPALDLSLDRLAFARKVLDAEASALRTVAGV